MPCGPSVVTVMAAEMSPSQLSVPVKAGGVTVGLHPRLSLSVAAVAISGAVRSSVQW